MGGENKMTKLTKFEVNYDTRIISRDKARELYQKLKKGDFSIEFDEDTQSYLIDCKLSNNKVAILQGANKKYFELISVDDNYAN